MLHMMNNDIVRSVENWLHRLLSVYRAFRAASRGTFLIKGIYRYEIKNC